MTKNEKAYTEILKVLNKYKDLHNFNIEDLEEKSKLHLYGLKLKNEYGLNINPKDIRSLDYITNLGEFMVICTFGEKSGRVISWSDDDSQPDNELLLNISFPTGAYIFGDDYSIETFANFFNELKSYKPKFTDSNNSSLYFSMDNAGEIYNNFNEILDKYIEINKEDDIKRNIIKLKKQLSVLENK